MKDRRKQTRTFMSICDLRDGTLFLRGGRMYIKVGEYYRPVRIVDGRAVGRGKLISPRADTGTTLYT